MNWVPLITISIAFLFIVGAVYLIRKAISNRKKHLKNKKSFVVFGVLYSIALISFVSYIVINTITVQTRTYGDTLEIIYTGTGSSGHQTKCYVYDENNVIQNVGEIRKITVMGDNASGNRFKAQKEGKCHIIALELSGGASVQNAELYTVSVDSKNNISYEKQKTNSLYEFYSNGYAEFFVTHQSKKYSIDRNKYNEIWDTLLAISGKMETCETPYISNEDSLTFISETSEGTVYRELTMYFKDNHIYCHNNYDNKDDWYCFYVDDYVNISRVFDSIQSLKS